MSRTAKLSEILFFWDTIMDCNWVVGIYSDLLGNKHNNEITSETSKIEFLQVFSHEHEQ